MNDFQTIHDIIDNSIKSSSYYTVIISSCVFISYTLIIKIIEIIKSKNRNRPIIEMSVAVKEVSNNVVKLNGVLDKFFQDSIRRENDKCKIAIELSFINYQSKIEHLCRDIIIHNNININKDSIISNITQTVNAEYYKIYSNLSLYEVNNKIVASHLKDKWIDETINDMINIIYNNQSDRDRISQITNKLTVRVNNYSTFIYNKTFNGE